MILKASNIAKSFGKKKVLKDVSFKMEPGSLWGIVGENGAGKSTLLKIIVGEWKADNGKILVNGKSGYCPQKALLFPQLTVEEHFLYFSSAYGIKKAKFSSRSEELLDHFNFEKYRKEKIANLSGGTQQKLNLSIVEFTTSERTLPFLLASLDDEVYIEISAKGISFIFFAVASAGFLVSFLALNLIQKNKEVNRRLIICGYHPIELLISTLLFLILMILLIAIYVGLLTNFFFLIDHLPLFLFGLVLIGFVYGCYGLAIGSLIKGELEGLFPVPNVDYSSFYGLFCYQCRFEQSLIRRCFFYTLNVYFL